MTPAIEVRKVSFEYGPHRPVLTGLDLGVRSGTFLAVAGPNGAGKSTLIHLMAGVLRPQSGGVFLEGRDLRSYGVRDLARRVALVRQEFVPAFGFSVYETVLMARTPCYGQWGFESRADREIVGKALERTDTARFASRPLGSLSAGERQRVFVARALAQDTPILLLDEPTSFLDLRHQVAIYDLLKSIQQETASTIVAVTHEINLASQYCDEALLLYPCRRNGPSLADPVSPPNYRIGSTREVFAPEEIRRAFGVGIFSGVLGSERFVLPLGERAKDANLLRPPDVV
jgi:iron complex transport system ATP-binding protein